VDAIVGHRSPGAIQKKNRRSLRTVLERGAFVSQSPIGSPPAPEDFPIRNRIIAGMPIGVLIVGKAI
jgi:DNA processing protein